MDTVECTSGAIVPTGVVSEMTLRAEDMLTAALKVYEAVDPAGYIIMAVQEAPILRTFAAKRAGELMRGEPCTFSTWEWAELLHLTADIVDWINDVLPAGWYYGGHPDDPACVGIWETE